MSAPTGNRGFTDQEAIPNLGLVNMNGRVYDPVVGRFLSPDPTIQVASDLQSHNRYSYATNNPLRYTDPTGYRPHHSTWADIAPFVDFLVYAGAIVVCVYSDGAACGPAFEIAGAITAGINVSAAISSGVPWDQAVTTGVISFAVGYMFGALGGAIGQGLISGAGGQILGGAIGGAATRAFMTPITGGDLGDNILEGAASGAFSAAVGVGIQNSIAVSQASAPGAGDAETSGMMRVEANTKQDAVVGVDASPGRKSPAGGPTAEELRQSPVVKGALKAAYADTNAGNPKLAHEEGGWIYMNVKNKDLITLRADPGPPGTGAKGYYEIDLNHPKLIPGYVVVGTYHAHPLTLDQLKPLGKWPRGPSAPDDIIQARKQGVPGFVIDPSGVYPYGPDQRLRLDNGLGFPGWRSP